MPGQNPLHSDGLLPLFLGSTDNHTSDSFQLLKVETHDGVVTVQTADPTSDTVPEPRWLAALSALLIAVLVPLARLRGEKAARTRP